MDNSVKEVKEANVYKQCLKLAVPMMIQNAVMNIVMLVDNLMVGSLGTESITAVSIASQLLFVFNLAVFGAVSGPGIYATQYYGQQNKEGFWNVFRLKFWLCLIVLIIGGLIFSFGHTFLINLFLHGSETGLNCELTFDLSKSYLLIMLWGLIPFTLTQVYASSLRETGESMLPMNAGILSVVVDIVFNYLLIFGKLGLPALGVKGAGLATVIARLAEVLLLLVCVHFGRKRNIYIADALRTFRVKLDNLSVVLWKSLPMFLNELMWGAGFTATNQCYSLKGLEVVAGLNIASTLFSQMIVVVMALGVSIGIVIGQYLGASEFEKAKKNSIKLTLFSGYISCIAMVILLCLRNIFPSLYETSEEIRQLGTRFIMVLAFFIPIHGIINGLYFTLRCGGKTLITFLFDSVYTMVLCLPVAFLLCKFSSFDIITIFIMVQSLDFIKLCIGYALVRKGTWISNIVTE